MLNDEFRNKKYALVKVRYNTGTAATYTYACKKSFRPETGMLVIVTTGDGAATLDNARIVQVGAITTDLKHIPEKIQLKEVIGVVG